MWKGSLLNHRFLCSWPATDCADWAGAGNVVRNLVTMGGKSRTLRYCGQRQPGQWFRQHCEEMAVESSAQRRPIPPHYNQDSRRREEPANSENRRGTRPGPIAGNGADGDRGHSVRHASGESGHRFGLRQRLLDPLLLTTLLQSARVHRIPVLVDPKGMDFAKYAGCTYITPNIKEASLASGMEIRDTDGLVRAGRLLLEQTGAAGLVITRGKDGSTLVTKKDHEDFRQTG